MFRLQPAQTAPALALFQNSPHQMKLTALAEGRIEAEVWADGAPPGVSAVLYQNKLLVASALHPAALREKLKDFLMEQIYARRMGGGCGEALVFWDGGGVRESLLEILAEKCPAYTLREYYELENPTLCNAAEPPQGYVLLPVDRALLGRGYGNTDRLREEMCSERASADEFLKQGFGVCAVIDGELAGWCLSEYNCSEGCEVGIEVVEGHRRRGLALAMVSAFAGEAAGRGVGRIGWHCFKSNLASAATARAAGFAKTLEYGELLCFFVPALQYAVNGNLEDGAGRYGEAVYWYGRSIAEKDPPAWARMRMAMAQASMGLFDSAFDTLRDAIQAGFNNWGWLRAEPRLEPLRADDQWKQLF